MRMAKESAGCGYLARDSDFSGGSLARTQSSSPSTLTYVPRGGTGDANLKETKKSTSPILDRTPVSAFSSIVRTKAWGRLEAKRLLGAAERLDRQGGGVLMLGQ